MTNYINHLDTIKYVGIIEITVLIILTLYWNSISSNYLNYIPILILLHIPLILYVYSVLNDEINDKRRVYKKKCIIHHQDIKSKKPTKKHKKENKEKSQTSFCKKA